MKFTANKILTPLTDNFFFFFDLLFYSFEQLFMCVIYIKEKINLLKVHVNDIYVCYVRFWFIWDLSF